MLDHPSDTLTATTEAMRRAMVEAEAGDDLVR
jgi:threonine aldolase